MSENEVYALFWDHVHELRRTLIQMMVIILIGVIVSFTFSSTLISWLTSSVNSSVNAKNSLIEKNIEYVKVYNSGTQEENWRLPEEAMISADHLEEVQKISSDHYLIPPGKSLIYTKAIPTTPPLVILGPLEGMLIAFKTSLWVGIVITSPIWLWALLRFIAPALHVTEKFLVGSFLLTSLVFISAGLAFAFWFTIPLANEYLMAFNQSLGNNLWSLQQYLNYTLFLMLANGFAFEMCAVGIFAVYLGLVTAETLASKRRIAIVMAFLIGALLTPPDVLTQCMLAIPLIFFYECIILFARFRNWVG